MGLLDGMLAPIVHGAFSGILLDGTLTRRTFTDNGKGGLTANAPTTVAIKVMVDPATETMRAEDGFNDRDVSLLILAHGVPYPKLDDEVTIATGPDAGNYHLLAPITKDAASTHYIARGRKK